MPVNQTDYFSCQHNYNQSVISAHRINYEKLYLFKTWIDTDKTWNTSQILILDVRNYFKGICHLSKMRSNLPVLLCKFYVTFEMLCWVFFTVVSSLDLTTWQFINQSKWVQMDISLTFTSMFILM